jgi:hypothetical protein
VWTEREIGLERIESAIAIAKVMVKENENKRENEKVK